MSSGPDLRHCFHHKNPRPDDRPKIIAASSMAFAGLSARAHRGGTCLSAMVPGKQSPAGFIAGSGQAYGSGSWRCCSSGLMLRGS